MRRNETLGQRASCPAMCRSSGSDQVGQMSWTPMGSPSFVTPSRTTSAGCLLALNGLTARHDADRTATQHRREKGSVVRLGGAYG
jgi:hypothetical protein